MNDSGLQRPNDTAYHAGPWKQYMYLWEAFGYDCQPTGRWRFLGCFMYWDNVETHIRAAMRSGDPWGCA